MEKFDHKALDKLKECRDHIKTEVPDEIIKNLWLGTSAKNWFSSFKTSWIVKNLPSTSLDRYKLLDIVSSYKLDENLSQMKIRELIIMIFSWGGMSRTSSTGKLAIGTIQNYEKVCLNLLKNPNPISAYEEFYEMQQSGVMRGIGPAYYTKLIFFLGDQKGLIMDQWTARSINLLFKNKTIILNYGHKNRYSVSKNNTKFVYQKYLDLMSDLTQVLSLTNISETEELIFSCSHKQAKVKKILGKYHKTCSAWRKYVEENT